MAHENPNHLPDSITIDELDQQALQELNRRVDPLGVVSTYVTVDPADPEAAGIDIGNRYRELHQRMSQSDRQSRSGVLAGLDRWRPEVERLTSPVASGRGRVLFAGLSDGWSLRLDSQMPMPNRVVLDDGPFIHPLLEMLDEGQAAGVALFSGESGRLLEWRLGRLRPLQEFQRQEAEAPHERAGQIGGGPPGQFHTPIAEHREARDQDLAQRFLARIADAVAGEAAGRGWTRMVVSGGRRWTGVLADQLPEPLRGLVIEEHRVLAGLSHQAVTDAVTDRLHEDHLATERRLVERIREAGLAGTAALGLSEVTAALNEGRVAHLVYDPEVRYSGAVGPNGALYAGAESAVGSEPGRPEPRLTERIIERALATGTRVSPVGGAAQGALREAAGIAALLRW
jgi:hypothetical protein